MSLSKEQIKGQQLMRLNVEFESKEDCCLKDDKPLQDVFDIILDHINLSELVNSGDG